MDFGRFNEIFNHLLWGVVLIGCSPSDKKLIELGIPALAKDVATGSLLYEEEIVKI